MPNDHAATLPAPDPLPGPTGISLSFAQLTKSATIRKYPAKPILFIISIS